MLALTVFTEDHETHNFICVSFKIRPSKTLEIHFKNGIISIDEDAYTDLVCYPHNSVTTDVFDPCLLA